jgi:DNA-binding XRE family transcriptional regulator
MIVQNKSSQLTTPSTSPVIKRLVFPFDQVNPGSKTNNVLAIVDSIVYAPLPDGYREINDVISTHERDVGRAAALARARQRLSERVDAAQKPTVAVLRLKAGLSQAKIAELLGNSQSSYSLIESGRRDILHSTFEKLTEILHVSRDELAMAIKNTQERSHD